MLVECPHVWGNATVVNTPPVVEQHDDVLYAPFGDAYFSQNPQWGIYARSGALIEAAALRIGPERALVGQSEASSLNFEDAATAPDQVYVYGGPFIYHYGHYVCSTLSRLWYVAQEAPTAKILFHSHYDVQGMLAIPHVRAAFQKLGLSEDNIVVFDKPTTLHRLIIPGPSFEEQSFVHPQYRDLCHLIGLDYADAEDAPAEAPVYLTKTGLAVGVGRIANEQVIEDYLRQKGVEIIHPELLSWPAQVRLFSQRRVIAGTTGSAFHTSIFSNPKARFVCLNTTDSVNSNLILADKINGNSTLYLYSQAGYEYQSNVENFMTLATLLKPEDVARELFDVIAAEDRIVRPSPDSGSVGGSPPARLIRPTPAHFDSVGVDKLAFATRNTLRTQIEQYGWSVGAHTYGTPDVMEPEYGTLKIGRFCSMASRVALILGNHRVDTVSTYPFRALSGMWPGAEKAASDHEGGGVEIGNDVWLGFGAVILPGARIGNGCVVRANSVVNGVVPDYAIVAGNPGSVVGMRFDDVTVQRLLAISWWGWDEATLMRFMPVLASGKIEVFLDAVERGAL